MPEDDWYGPFSRGRAVGYLYAFGGLLVVAFALAGFTFRGQITYDGVSYPPTQWSEDIQWPPLAVGAMLFSYGVYKARNGTRNQ